ncbi:hypothetical protein GCM10011297_24250 [Bacterioplanes sanyensis]|uniref:CYTH domain-containing protein n=1 Tax=Bacterioplanes sanyensis TaxID=1249553 RepID=UPI0016731FA0|nr:CYTH domain-containing protein [Bacterioplanes sanyensis]GGY50532.1 hypothetical protein GCM10011297_24250 [Bacterioplanes sanyensis]
MTTEIELKLRLQPEHLATLTSYLDQYARRQDCQHLSNQYFDTAASDLAQQRCALRVRKISDGSYEQTLKTAGQLQDGIPHRREWNWPIDSDQFDPALLQDDDIRTELPDELDIDDLTRVFRTDFERHIWWWEQPESQIEVVIDEGTIDAGDQQQSLCEVELELKHGSASDLWQLAERLAEHCPLWLSDISKAEQGYRLAQLHRGWQPEEHIHPDSSTSEALQQWLQQAVVGLQRSLELALWHGDSQAGLEAWQYWHALKQLPVLSSKVLKRRDSKVLRELLSPFEQPLAHLSALVTAGRFSGASDLYAAFRQQAARIRGDGRLAAALLAIVQQVQKLPLEHSQESALQRIQRIWRDEAEPILQAAGNVSAEQWADRQVQYARLRQLYLCRHSLQPEDVIEGAAAQQHRTRVRLLSDMLAGTTLLQVCRRPEAELGENSATLRDEFAQYVPLELNSRLLQLRPQL